MNGVLVLAALCVGLSACSGDSDSAGEDAGTGDDACERAQSSCEACLVCAATGACADLSTACADSEHCSQFARCIGEGDDDAVIAQCRADHAGGAEEYCADTRCTVYQECGDVCEPSQVCPQ